MSNQSNIRKVSVHTSTEAEEAVAELFGEILGQPVSVYVDAQNQATTVSVYLPRASDFSSTKAEALRVGLQKIKAAGLRIGSGRIEVRSIQRQDWAESWKRHFKPIEIGKSLLLKPSWSKQRAKKQQAVVVLDPGLSFG